MNLPLILASESPTRLKLLEKIYVKPDFVIPANIDETNHPKELPNNLALRLAVGKAEKIANEVTDGYIIAADTVVAKGRRILPKAMSADEVKECMEMLSGCRHRVYTGICVIKKSKEDFIIRKQLVYTTVKFKRLSKIDIDFYLSTHEGLSKAGGYGIFGFAEAFIAKVMGTYSTVAGLPLLETRNMLLSVGFNNFTINS